MIRLTYIRQRVRLKADMDSTGKGHALFVSVVSKGNDLSSFPVLIHSITFCC